MLKPHPAGITAFDGGGLNKSFSAMSLNKVTRTYGGGSGYRSEARRTVTQEGKYKSVGKTIPPTKVVKTTIHYKSKGENKAMSKTGYIVKNQAFTLVPFVHKVVYQDRLGEKMTLTNTNIK